MDGTHRAMGNGAAVAPEEVSMASRGTTPRPEADPSRIRVLRPHRVGLRTGTRRTLRWYTAARSECAYRAMGNGAAGAQYGASKVWFRALHEGHLRIA